MIVDCQYIYKDACCGYKGEIETCDMSLEDCKRHGNIQRFGGFPTLDNDDDSDLTPEE